MNSELGKEKITEARDTLPKSTRKESKKKKKSKELQDRSSEDPFWYDDTPMG